jgi:hypothetical protein
MTPRKSNSSFPIKPPLKDIRSDVCLYIKYLELENSKLQRNIAQLQVANLSISNKNDEMVKLLAKKDKEIEISKNSIKKIEIISTRDIARIKNHIKNHPEK